MRLINTRTGLLEDFIGDNIPVYAILSHTWEEDEISFQEFQRFTDPDFAHDPKTILGRAKAGYIKIQGCVQLAISKRIPYIWVDTCCIDKTSSADLTESINSMYQWYADSKVCFAYLVDVEAYEHGVKRHAWEESRWFTRGWTLQELIAPREVEFYCHSWRFLGTKDSLSHKLSKVTGIHTKVLRSNDLSSISVAQKMFWASQRRTTRKEDMAYCLLGLFDINMPLLYGEGESAFLRLQEHIAASSTDHSIFAWGVPARGAVGEELRSYRGIFARSPADFSQSGTLKEYIIVHPDTWAKTNRGFHCVFPTIRASVVKELFHESDGFLEYIDDEDYLMILNCRIYDSSDSSTSGSKYCGAGIWIGLIDARDDGKDGFCRVTDTITCLPLAEVFKLLDSSSDKFQKDLWLATTPRMIRIPPDHFSKRLSGFLVSITESYQLPQNSSSVHFEFHGVYGKQVSGKIIIFPRRPLSTMESGGLVGLVTIQMVNRGGIYQKETAAVIFGYPSNSTKPFAKVFKYLRDGESVESPLDFAVRKFIEPDDEGKKHYTPWDYKYKLFGIDLSLGTVFHKDMIFTQLDIQLSR